MWWLWPFVALLIVIWTISLGGSRGGYQDGIGCCHIASWSRNFRSSRSSPFVPSSIKTRVLGERVNVACQGISLEGQVFTEGGNILSIQDIRDWVGSRLLAERLFSPGVFGYSRWSQSPIYKSRHRANIATSQLSAVAFV